MVLRRGLPLVRRRALWLVRPPRVRGSVPRALPGALRIDDSEEQEAVDAVRAVIRSKRLFRYGGTTGNPFETSRVRRLERSFAATMGTEYALALNSGTSALVCGLVALGVGAGDEVIVPAYTWFSTASAVRAAGAIPVVAEVDESLTLDPDDARAKVSSRTRAIVAVHMRGAPAAMDRLGSLADERGLGLLEDAAQAAGASFRGRRLGTIGDMGAYSFQMSKTITAGEGGMLVTRDRDLHRRAAMYHDSAAMVHMGLSAEEWTLAGLNMRMSELQAAVAEVQLRRLDALLAAMRARKRVIEERIGEGGVHLRATHDAAGDAGLALIFFVADSERAERVVAALVRDNVPATRLYKDGRDLPDDYIDLHAYPSWRPLLPGVERPEDVCPLTVGLLRRAVHIDVSPDLTEAQAEQIGTAILVALGR